MVRNIPQRGSVIFAALFSNLFILGLPSPYGRRFLSWRPAGGSSALAFVTHRAILSPLSYTSSAFYKQREVGSYDKSWKIEVKKRSESLDSNNEPRTGWLHNTKPKEDYGDDNNDEYQTPSSSSTSSLDTDLLKSTNEVVVEDDITLKSTTSGFTTALDNIPAQASVASAAVAPPPNNFSNLPFTIMNKQNIQHNMASSLNHRIIAPPVFHPCNGSTKFMVSEHKITVPLYHADLELAASETRNSATTSDSNKCISLVDRKDIISAIQNHHHHHHPNQPSTMIDIYFVVIETTSSGDEDDLLVALSNPHMCPRERADVYLMRGVTPSNGYDNLHPNDKSSSYSGSIDASRMMLYLQGGPGFGCAAPSVGLGLGSSTSSWASKVLSSGMTNAAGKTFERVILMDQRGTGKSSPISQGQLKKLFPNLFLFDGIEEDVVRTSSSEPREIDEILQSNAVIDAVEYLSKFRADSIVRDAEWIKEALIRHPLPAIESTAKTTTSVTGMGEENANKNVSLDNCNPQPWGAALGQSYGGFCLMTYLSSMAHPPKLCLFTGGIAPAYTSVREVYDRLWSRVATRNYKYYGQYPGDITIVKRIVRRLSSSSLPTVQLPSGGILTARRFLQLGLGLGGSPGTSFANLHSLINSAFLNIDDNDDELSRAFLKRVDHEQSFDDAPLYFLLHESIYADGPMSAPTNWAAHSSYEEIISSTQPEFDYRQTSVSDDHNNPTLFFGEMVFPWMAHGDYAELSGNGMKLLSEALAKKKDWSPLYDKVNMRAALLGGGNAPPKCKAASATYYDDMYVDFDCAMKQLKRDAPLEGVQVWVTNEYQHSGLRDDGANIVCKLLNMAKGNIHLPS